MQLPKEQSWYYELKDGKDNKYANYLYKRGFLIADKPCHVKDDWKKMNFGGKYYITYDPENECVYITDDNNYVLILGNAMDTIAYSMDLNVIGTELLTKYSRSIQEMYDYIDTLCGRHIVVMGGDDKEPFLVQDAMGLRSVFYHRNKTLIASHYNLVHDFSGDERHPFMSEYLNMTPTPWLLPGNITPYENIVALLPNHVLNIRTLAVKRFWPRENHRDVSVDEAMDYIAGCLKKQISLLAENRKIMIGLTKGNDSRVTLAACKDIANSVLFWSYFGKGDPGQTEDARFTKEYTHKFGLNYLQIDTTERSCTIDEWMQIQSVAFMNHYHKHNFEAIPAYFNKLPKGRISIRSIGTEIVRSDYYGAMPNYAQWEDLAKGFYSKYLDNKTVCDAYKNLYDEFEYDKLFNYLAADIFYWEYRMGLWMGAAVVVKDDINFDTWVPFNCRKILEYGLSVPRYYKKSDTIIYEVIRRLWPDLWFDIPNTDYTLIDYYLPGLPGQVDLKNSVIETGNKILKDRKVAPYTRIGRYNADVGFSENTVFKGDFIALNLDIPIMEAGTYDFQITINVPAKWKLEPYCSNYSIYIDGDRVYTKNLNDFKNKDNQINILKRKAKNENAKLRIELESSRDFTVIRGVAGFMSIKSVNCDKTSAKISDEVKYLVGSTEEIIRKMKV